jgi:hypothetical protein
MRRLLIAVIAIFAIGQAATSDAAPPPTGLMIQNEKGSLPGGGTFTGNLLIDWIVPEGLNSQKVRVVGTISGTAVTADDTVHQITNEPFSTVATLTSNPAPNAVTAQQAATCSILDLDLSPIDLNVLGLMVTLPEITINTAIQNSGILGNLLCSLANALATGTPLGSVLRQLHQLLSGISVTLRL